MEDDLKFLSRIVSAVSLGKRKNLKSEISKALTAGVNLKRIEEAILQCYLFAGFPAVIEGFSVLRELAQGNFAKPRKYDVKKFYSNGIKTCRKVYRKNFDKLVKNVKSLHPELFEWMIIEGYGKVLSRDILSLKERELLNVAILTSLGWERQLLSHLKGALNTGANLQELNKLIKTISNICGKKKINKAKDIIKSL